MKQYYYYIVKNDKILFTAYGSDTDIINAIKLNGKCYSAQFETATDIKNDIAGFNSEYYQDGAGHQYEY